MIKRATKLITLVILLFSASMNAQTVYKANAKDATIQWKGFKPTGDHYGVISLKSGDFNITDGNLTGGTFVVDMNTIVDLDMPADDEYNAKLVGHLKADDFFGVAKHPTSTFKITHIKKKEDKYLVKGDLTIKEITHSIEFVAMIKISDSDIVFTSETFKIDRTKWDIKFKSKSFFESLGDNFIYDEIEMSFEVKGSK